MTSGKMGHLRNSGVPGNSGFSCYPAKNQDIRKFRGHRGVPEKYENPVKGTSAKNSEVPGNLGNHDVLENRTCDNFGRTFVVSAAHSQS